MCGLGWGGGGGGGGAGGRGRELQFSNSNDHHTAMLPIMVGSLRNRTVWSWHLSHNLRKNGMGAQIRLESIFAFALSDQGLRFLHEKTLHSWLSKTRPVKVLIRLR